MGELDPTPTPGSLTYQQPFLFEQLQGQLDGLAADPQLLGQKFLSRHLVLPVPAQQFIAQMLGDLFGDGLEMRSWHDDSLPKNRSVSPIQFSFRVWLQEFAFGVKAVERSGGIRNLAFQATVPRFYFASVASFEPAGWVTYIFGWRQDVHATDWDRMSQLRLSRRR